MVVFGTAGIPQSCSGNIIDAINWNAEHGLKALEIEFVRGVWGKQELFKKAKQTALDKGVVLSAHAPYYINLLSIEPEKVKASFRRILSSCKRAYWAGAKNIVIHTGYYGKLDKKTAFDTAVEMYKQLLDELDKLGLDDIVLSPEVLGKRSQFACFEDIVELCKQIDSKRIRPTIDFAHIGAMQKFDLTKEKGFIDVFNIAISKLKTKRFHIHFSGVEYGEKGEKRHLTFEQAKTPDYKLFVKVLKKLDIQGEVICESPAREFDTLKLLEEYLD